MALGMEPIITSRVRDLAGTTIDILDAERPPQALATELPIIKQPLRAARNIAEMTGATTTEGMLQEALRMRNSQD